jgi:hypothetical protein
MDSPPSPSPTPRPPKETSQEKESSAAYLRSLLDKNLRITTTDKRMFWGAFKCTDHVRSPPLPNNPKPNPNPRKATSYSNTLTNTATPP